LSHILVDTQRDVISLLLELIIRRVELIIKVAVKNEERLLEILNWHLCSCPCCKVNTSTMLKTKTEGERYKITS